MAACQQPTAGEGPAISGRHDASQPWSSKAQSALVRRRYVSVSREALRCLSLVQLVNGLIAGTATLAMYAYEWFTLGEQRISARASIYSSFKCL